MELCSIGHDEVCYEGNSCPACAVQDKMQILIDSLQRDNDLLTVELDMVKEALKSLTMPPRPCNSAETPYMVLEGSGLITL